MFLRHRQQLEMDWFSRLRQSALRPVQCQVSVHGRRRLVLMSRDTQEMEREHIQIMMRTRIRSRTPSALAEFQKLETHPLAPTRPTRGFRQSGCRGVKECVLPSSSPFEDHPIHSEGRVQVSIENRSRRGDRRA